MSFNVVVIGDKPLLLVLFEKYTGKSFWVVAQTASKYLSEPLKKKKLFMAFIFFRCYFPVNIPEWKMSN